PSRRKPAELIHVPPCLLVVEPERRQRPPRPRLARFLDQRAQSHQVHPAPLGLRHQTRQQRLRGHFANPSMSRFSWSLRKLAASTCAHSFDRSSASSLIWSSSTASFTGPIQS